VMHFLLWLRFAAKQNVFCMFPELKQQLCCVISDSLKQPQQLSTCAFVWLP